MLIATGGSKASGVRMMVVNERTTSRNTFTGNESEFLLSDFVLVKLLTCVSMITLPPPVDLDGMILDLWLPRQLNAAR